MNSGTQIRNLSGAAIIAAALALGAPSQVVAVDTGGGGGGGGGGGSSGSSASKFDVAKEMRRARAKIAAEQYKVAIRILRPVIRADRRNADAYNLLGFASRKVERYDAAAKYYVSALRIDPDHLGALEYQGELFLLLDQLENADANLARLLSLCGVNCEEYRDLKRDVAVHQGSS